MNKKRKKKILKKRKKKIRKRRRKKTQEKNSNKKNCNLFLCLYFLLFLNLKKF